MKIRVTWWLLFVALFCRGVHATTLYDAPLFGVAKTSNILYGTGLVNGGASSLDLKLDIYQPTDIGTPVPASRPSLLFIHGGSWQTGDKSQIPQVNVWTSHGYNVVSINYRLLGDNPPPTSGPADPFAGLGTLLGPPGIITAINASIEDAHLAMEWMYDNAAAYGIDPQRIGVAGHSAGATNALILGHLSPSQHVQPRAVISTGGALFGSPNPFQPDGPPVFLVGGANDSIVPPELFTLTSYLLTESGVPHEYYLQPGTGHGTNWNMVTDGKTLSRHAVEFLARELVSVPEPSSALLAAVGVLVLALRPRRAQAKGPRS